jgi:CubicO group peptidase (beta-lactamase class C family)
VQRIDPAKLHGIDAAVLTAIRAGEAPGAVVLVLHEGETAFLRSYGDRAQRPSRAPMSVDTVFDLALLCHLIREGETGPGSDTGGTEGARS